MRLALIAAAWLCASTVANAIPINIVTVGYEGTVTESTWAGSGPKIGDRVSGALVIDLDHAPPNISLPGDAAFYQYRSSEDDTFPSFVDGFAPRRHSLDHVSIADHFQGKDSFQVEDAERSLDGRFFDSLLLNAFGTLDFISGTGLVQQLELRPEDFGSDAFGEGIMTTSHQTSKHGFGGTVRFVLDRLKVTPGSCSR